MYARMAAKSSKVDPFGWKTVAGRQRPKYGQGKAHSARPQTKRQRTSTGSGSSPVGAKIVGADDTPYSGGIFKLEIQIPERYPFEPPKVQFITPIYHPNIDTGGRICLDTLKMPPKGAWKPCMNVSSVLTSIQLLMTEPNPDDPLMTDISNEFKHNRTLFQQNARLWTLKHAKTHTVTKTDNDTEHGDTSVKCKEDTTKKGNKRTQPMSEATNKQPKII